MSKKKINNSNKPNAKIAPEQSSQVQTFVICVLCGKKRKKVGTLNGKPICNKCNEELEQEALFADETGDTGYMLSGNRL